MRVSGKMTKLMAMGDILTSMELSMRESGNAISSMVKALSSGQMAHFMRGTSKMVAKREREFCTLLMVQSTKANSVTMRSMVMAPTNGVMERRTLGNGRVTRCKAKAI
jgi:hypothetical protein